MRNTEITQLKSQSKLLERQGAEITYFSVYDYSRNSVH